MSFNEPINNKPEPMRCRCPFCGRQVLVGKKDKIEPHAAAKNLPCPGEGLKAKRSDLKGGK